GSSPEPGFVVLPGRTEVQHVEGVAGTECELDVYTAELHRELAVLVLGVDQVDLDTQSERAHSQRRQEVGLARARVAEHGDVRVRISALVERVDHHRAAGGP